jgi:putative oxidoreductase
MVLPVMKAFVEKYYTLLIRVANSLQSPFLLLIRLYWGYQFHITGRGKLHDLDKVTGFFTNLGIPAPHANAVFVSSLEFLGGFLLIVGLASRPIALACVIDMIVAFVLADREALGSIFSDPDKFYAASPYPFLFAFLIILIFGPGKLSLDALIAKRLAKKS